MTAQNSFPFKNVRHGYDPAEVDKHVVELQKAVQDAHDRADQLADQLDAGDRSKAGGKPMPPVEPTFHDFGKRIGRILAMAEEEAEEMRSAAVTEVDSRLAEAEETAERTRREADEYAAETRNGADEHASTLVEGAKRQADQMADEAERMAIARSGEAEALYEEQRAKSAKAAADFEQTLADRRTKSEAQFQERAQMADKELEAARNRVAKLRAEGDQLQAEAARRAQQLQGDAERKAEQIVADAMERADRIRSESERELAAATQRRNAINAQLANVRQMLATLSGAAGGGVLAEDSEDSADSAHS
jgi:cell division septum initiation protein DivIVA